MDKLEELRKDMVALQFIKDGNLRMIATLMAAVDLCDEVEQANGEVPRSLTDAAARFRKAMRGEL